jgi:hypothetical protein
VRRDLSRPAQPWMIKSKGNYSVHSLLRMYKRFSRPRNTGITASYPTSPSDGCRSPHRRVPIRRSKPSTPDQLTRARHP